jgi:Bacterial lectin/PQQ-like domain/Abnormal spindle-like microcephaly-assoc'd, ASPM-SPD-2-Hydin
MLWLYRHAVNTAGRRPAVVALSATILLTAVAVTTGAAPLAHGGTARADEVTISQDNLRDGWDPNEPGLAPSVVSGSTFGQLFSTRVDGQVYAQPVVAGPTVIVATENDHVYGLDSVTGAVNWSDNLGPAEPASEQGCNNLTPSVGITGTPVYDPSAGTVYLVALVNDGPDPAHPHMYLYALDAQTGTVQWKVPIRGAAVNSPTQTFAPLAERQRTGLLMLNGWVYVGFASYCDFSSYTGYVAGVNTTSKALMLWSAEAGLTDTKAGIWQSGAGLMSDGTGRIFLTTGNGISPTKSPGTTPPQELGDATVRLSAASDGLMSSADYFSPANAPALDAADTDFGSGGPVGLAFGDPPNYPHLLVQAGKDGRVFLLNRDNLGGREQGASNSDLVVSKAGPYQGQWGHPAAFGPTPAVSSATSNDYVYYVGKNDNLRYLQFGVSGSGTPVLTDVANSTTTFPYASGSPVVTSNGSDPASATVWEMARSGSSSMLEAFAGAPSAACTSTSPCTMKPIWSAPIGTATKFSVPATDSGRIYAATQDGVVFAFGSPDAAPVGGATPVNFGPVTVGQTSAPQNVTVKAAATVTISAISTSSVSSSDPFASGPVLVNGTPATLPVTLSPGDAMTVPVTFMPTAPGGVAGSLNFATGSPNFPTIGVGLSGNGTQSGFYAAPNPVSFGSVPDGTSLPINVTITNGGSTAETVNGTTSASMPFTVTGLPSANTVVQPGASLTANVTYKPTAAQPDSSTFTITGTDANHIQTTLTVTLSGTGVTASSQFTPVPTAVNFGDVPLGTQATQTVDITNAGNLPATVTATVPPTVPFGTPQQVASGLPVNPTNDVEIPITFTPASLGPVSGSYRLTWTDAQGSHNVTIPISGTGAARSSGIAVPPPGGGWTLNGSAQMSGTSVALTQAVNNQAGSAVYSVPVPSDGLNAKFTAKIGGGTGADGLTFSLLDATKASPAALGGAGAGLGFGGLPGIAVALDTHKASGYPSSNFVGIATGTSGSLLHFAATTTNVPNLRSGPRVVAVAVAGQQVTVTIDGKKVLSATLPAGTVPSSVLAAFTGGTGGLDDVHSVSGVTITAGGNPLPAPGGRWSFNGTARMSGSDTVLTRAVKNQTGAVVYPTAVKTLGLQVQFNAQLSGGTGADGLTFALLNPAKSTATSLGTGGGGLGFAGLNGVAVTLDTWKDTGYPTNNFAGLSNTASNGLLKFQAFARVIPPLRTGTHTIVVDVTLDTATGADAIIVYLDGGRVLARDEPTLTATSLVAFTGGTGGVTDFHIVRDVAISAS